MRQVLAPDSLVTDAFAGPVLTATSFDPEMVAGRRVGVLAVSPAHVRLLPDVVRAAGRTKLFVTRPVQVLPAGRLGQVAQHAGPAARAVAALHRWRALPEPELRRKVTPVAAGAPTVLSGEFHRAVQHRSCEVVAWPVAGIVAAGVRTADGIEHHLDVLLRC